MSKTILLLALVLSACSQSESALKQECQLPVPRKGESEARLRACADLGYDDLLRYFIESGARIDAKDNSGCTALHIAARAGRVSTVRMLLSLGASVQTADPFGNTPLHAAFATRRPEAIAMMLLEKGASPNVRGSSGRTPLHLAAQRNLEIIVARMLGKGASPFVMACLPLWASPSRLPRRSAWPTAASR